MRCRPTRTHYSDSEPTSLKVALIAKCCVLSEEATNTNFIVFGLTRPGLEPTIFRTRDEHANHYAMNYTLKLKHNIKLLVYMNTIKQNKVRIVTRK